MREDRFLALIAFLLALIAGLLIILDAANIRRNASMEEILTGTVVPILIGFSIIIAGAMEVARLYLSAGLVTLLLGIIVLVMQYGLIPGILAIVAGVLGIVATALRPSRFAFYRLPR